MSLGSTQRVTVEGGFSHKVSLAAIQLVVTSGPDAGARLVLSQDAVLIGTDASNDLVLTDSAVSRRHCRVELVADGLALQDLGSTNGTWFRDIRIERAALPPSTSFRVGGTTIGVERVEDELLARPDEREQLGGLVGASRAMKELWALMRVVAPAPVTVLIHGETGTGKEEVARTLHALSQRRGPLVGYDCASASRELVRSELFGHARGAFTGATDARDGAFRKAHRGTLFLDEIGDLPADAQPMLLRTLETREVQPLGADSAHPVDVRVICATHVDLAAAVAERRFRADLLYRLNVVRLDIPPLRQRVDDIPVLFRHFQKRLGLDSSLTDEALARLAAHPWPGNVRELRNVVERTGLLCQGRPIRAADLALDAAAPAASDRPVGEVNLETVERDAIFEALRRTGGHQAQAAKLLGIGLSTLKAKLRLYRERRDEPGT